MKSLAGAIRVLLVVCVLVGGLVPTLLLALVPGRLRGARPSSWCITVMCRMITRIFGIRFACTDPHRYATHHGLVFTNHSSFVDIFALMHVAPVRFLSAVEVQRRPVIGWLASSVETVFVERRDKQSRRAARRSISSALKRDPFPPIALFPEGRLGPGDHLMPFRYGAFELAVENQSPYLLCALRYNRPEITTWHGGTRDESLVAAVWRLATYSPGITVDLIPLGVTRPTVADDAAILAAVAQRTVEQALGFAPGPTLVEEARPAEWQVA